MTMGAKRPAHFAVREMNRNIRKQMEETVNNQNTMIKTVMLSFCFILAAGLFVKAQTWNYSAAVSKPNTSGTAYFFDNELYSIYSLNSGTLTRTRSSFDYLTGEKYNAGWDHIDAATQFNDNIYIFRGREYVRLGLKPGTSGGPSPIAGNFASNWPNWDTVDAATNLGNGNVYFFKGREYIRYEISSGKVQGPPKPIAGNFAKNWPAWSSVDSAVNLGNGIAYFFSGDQYFRYTISTAECSTPQKIIGNFAKISPTAITVPVTTQQHKPSQVNGLNVTTVEYGGAGTGKYRQIQGKVWVLYTLNNVEVARLVETGRDEWSVYLRKADGTNIQLDLWTKEVKINGSKRYSVTRVWAP